jgi:hypothetical protein
MSFFSDNISCFNGSWINFGINEYVLLILFINCKLIVLFWSSCLIDLFKIFKLKLYVSSYCILLYIYIYIYYFLYSYL